MALRTTAALVAGIIETDATAIPDLTPFITVANELVTEVCVPSDYSDERLEIIERWLAAHFYAVRDNRRSYETVESITEAFQYKVGLNLACTMYGQQAMLLDTKGGLAALNKRAEVGAVGAADVVWLGTEWDEG